MKRILLSVDLVGVVVLMAEASYYNRKIICGIGFILLLTCMWLFGKLREN